MKTINVEIKAICPNCGSSDHLEYSGDRTFATCTFCGKTYPGGEEEIREKMLEMPEVQEQLRAVAAKEAEKHIHQELKKVLKGIKASELNEMEDFLEIIKQWGGLTTGCLGIAGSIFVYLRSDRKLKSQQKQLNELQLELLSEERDDKKKAHLNVVCQKRTTGSYDLVIANSGKSTANNVRLKILTPIFCTTPDNNTQIYQSIAPQGVRKNIRLHKTTTDPDEFEIEISWDDEFKINNTGKMVIGYN